MADFDDFDGIGEVDVPEIEDGGVSSTGNTDGINNDPITLPVDDDPLSVSEEDLTALENKASDLDRNEADKSQIPFGRKMCPTRGGCQGATDCNYSYGSYPG